MKTTTYYRYPRYLRRFRNLDTDDFLRSVGLQTRRSVALAVLSNVGLFASGLLLGAGLGMAFAPRRGEQIRREMREKAGAVKARVGQYAERAKRQAEEMREQTPPAPPNS